MLSLRRITSTGLKSQLPVLCEISQRRNQTTLQHSLKYGQGGRLSFNGNVVTVFGATGVLGQYVVSQLARQGTQLVVPFRGSEDDVRDIRVMGDLGQIVFLEYDVRDYDSIVKSLSHSNVAINLVGKNHGSRNFPYEACHVDAAAAIATAAAECGVNNLVHVSHLQANAESRSIFMQMKAAGEKAVLEKFPTATMVRPAETFGDEDELLNRFAYMRKLPHIPLVGSGWDTMKLPVYSRDVAEGISTIALDPTNAGKTFELYGPEEYHLREIVDYVFRQLREDLRVVNIPLSWYENIGKLFELSPFGARWSQERVIRENLSEVATSGASTFADLGITPTNINDVGIGILRRHRRPAIEEQMVRAEDDIRPSHVVNELRAVLPPPPSLLEKVWASKLSHR